jgi:ATP synthase protein I
VTEEPDGLLRSVRTRRERRKRWLLEGEPSLGRHLAQVGVLGWTIVVPALIGMFAGRWLDRRLGTGIFWTGPLLIAGLSLGCCSAWKWMQGK